VLVVMQLLTWELMGLAGQLVQMAELLAQTEAAVTHQLNLILVEALEAQHQEAVAHQFLEPVEERVEETKLLFQHML
jgi:hypothetical protein